MKTYVAQIYIDPEARFPFSHKFQVWIHHMLSEMIIGWGKSENKYRGNDLLFNLSSKYEINEVEIYGPSIDKRGKTVEYTVFIPLQIFGLGGRDGVKRVIFCLMKEIIKILDDLGVERNADDSQFALIAELVAGNQDMIDPK